MRTRRSVLGLVVAVVAALTLVTTFAGAALAQAGHFVGTPTCTDIGTQVRTGLLRCRVAPGHGVDEVVWAVVGASGGAGDVGLTVAAVVADRRVTERGEHGGAVAGLGLVSVFTQRDVPDVVDAVLDVPLRPRPCAEIGGLGVREAQPARGGHGDRLDRAGLLAPVTDLAAAVADRHLRPGQRLELGA